MGESHRLSAQIMTLESIVERIEDGINLVLKFCYASSAA